MDGWATNQVKLFYYRDPPVVRVSHLCYNTILKGAKMDALTVVANVNKDIGSPGFKYTMYLLHEQYDILDSVTRNAYDELYGVILEFAEEQK